MFFLLLLAVLSLSTLSPVRASCASSPPTNCPGTIAGSSFKPVACYVDSFPRNIPYSGYAPTHAGCPAYCRNYAGFFYNAYYGACYCSSRSQSGDRETACVTPSIELYTHSEAAQASGLVRRRYAEMALAEEEAAKAILCTGGKQACLIAEGSDAFECIDTTQELESCGGCRYGSAGGASSNGVTSSRLRIQGRFQKKKEEIGTDCSSIPGVSLSGVSCSFSSCTVYKCRSGWTLKEGKCVRSR